MKVFCKETSRETSLREFFGAMFPSGQKELLSDKKREELEKFVKYKHSKGKTNSVIVEDLIELLESQGETNGNIRMILGEMGLVEPLAIASLACPTLPSSIIINVIPDPIPDSIPDSSAANFEPTPQPNSSNDPAPQQTSTDDMGESRQQDSKT